MGCNPILIWNVSVDAALMLTLSVNEPLMFAFVFTLKFNVGSMVTLMRTENASGPILFVCMNSIIEATEWHSLR